MCIASIYTTVPNLKNINIATFEIDHKYLITLDLTACLGFLPRFFFIAPGDGF